MIALLPTIIAAVGYLIWQSNRTAYDRQLKQQISDSCYKATSILKEVN